MSEQNFRTVGINENRLTDDKFTGSMSKTCQGYGMDFFTLFRLVLVGGERALFIHSKLVSISFLNVGIHFEMQQQNQILMTI